MPTKRLIALFVSLALLAALLLSLNTRLVFATLLATDSVLFGVAILFFIPQTAVIAWRWRFIARPVASMHVEEATRQVLASNTLNLVLPSKLGDLAKGVYLYRRGRCSLGTGLQVVVFEKLLDLAALSFWMLAGWLLFPSVELWVVAMLGMGLLIIALVWGVYLHPPAVVRVVNAVPARVRAHRVVSRLLGVFVHAPHVLATTRARGGRQRVLLASSLLIWFLHLAQIYVFFLAVGATPPFLEVLARMPIAIFAGLLPLSIAGVGIRDWAMVGIFAGASATPEQVAAAALLVSLRYVVPALAGLPFMVRYLSMGRAAKDRLAA